MRRCSGEALEKMDVNLSPGIVRLLPLRPQAHLLVHLDPALKVGNRSRVGSRDFELVAGGHVLDLLLRLHPVLLAQGPARDAAHSLRPISHSLARSSATDSRSRLALAILG